MLVGYMRVSTGVDERHCSRIGSAAAAATVPAWARALAFLRPGDCLVVWRLDRLG